MPNRFQTLESPAIPNIPSPRAEYDPKLIHGTNSIFRNFFIRITESLRALFGHYGGQYVDMPLSLFFSTTQQSIATINTAQPIEFETTYLSHGISIVDDTKIVVAYPGVYTFQTTMQLASTSSSSKHAFFWIRRNGVDIQYSTKPITISGSDAKSDVMWSFNIDLDAQEYIEMIWAADDLTVVMYSTTPTSPHVGVPSAVCSVTYAGPMVDPRPTPP